ncbi:ABC transporter substrate-binding protein [Natronomonas sp.]|uniref:ABC transporter substrate-binding protein n=1 Tax=Natronomonas sp. TaxID=2184060 RepID=UPI002FC2C705
MQRTTPTRREVLGAGAAGAVGLFAGCVSGATPGEDGENSGSRTVSMEPVGEVTLDGVPENVANYFPGYADMAVALGHGDAINSTGVINRYHTDHYEELDGVDINKESLTELVTDSGIDKEVFYELNSDLHLIDPKWLINNGFFGFEESDIEDLENDVAPFFGNTVFRRTDAWHDYRYYTMYETFEKVAAVFDERDRYEAFAEFHDDFIAEIQANLPPADSRPNGLLCFAAGDEPEAFSPYRLTDKGTNKKQFRDLGITDALAGTGIEGLSTNDRGQIDYETMLEVDPDSILIRGHETKTREEFEETVLAFMEDHDVASDLTAVQEGQVFRGGPIYSGPVHHLFLTERYAKLYFPESYSGGLFHREELAGIITE